MTHDCESCKYYLPNKTCEMYLEAREDCMLYKSADKIFIVTKETARGWNFFFAAESFDSAADVLDSMGFVREGEMTFYDSDHVQCIVNERAVY